MFHSRPVCRRARIRGTVRRSKGRGRVLGRRGRYAIRFERMGHAVPIPRPAPAVQLREASRSLESAMVALDDIARSVTTVRSDCRSEVHEALGLIVESLRLVASVHGRLIGRSGLAGPCSPAGWP